MAFSVYLSSSLVWFRPDPIPREDTAVQAHTYRCASIVSSLVTMEILNSNILRCIVVGMILISTVYTPKRRL